MRLLHTATLKLEEFLASSPIDKLGVRRIPEYAILSHTWGQEELSYQDMTGDRTIAEQKAGFNKVRDSCWQARSNGYEYIWIDTCCIDKTSSAELSEAINSMFKWYKDSSVCYAYLSDVLVGSTQPSHISVQSFSTQENGLPPKYSRWFSRGWTLQELVAPTRLQFFDKNWISIGWKDDCIDVISSITNIDVFALNGGDLRRLTIARKMIWTAYRQTTRAEDMAYCLLGLFNINMPLMYGEGDKAFIRLQEEILKTSTDSSLFAWTNDLFFPGGYHPRASDLQGLLAPAPHYFLYSGDIHQFHSRIGGGFHAVSTSKGVQLEFLMCQDPYSLSHQVYLAILGCPIGPIPGHLPAIRLQRLGNTEDQFTRVELSKIHVFACVDPEGKISLDGFDPREPQNLLVDTDTMNDYPAWTIRSIFVKQDAQLDLPPAFWLSTSTPSNPKPTVIDGIPRDLWDPMNGILQPQEEPNYRLPRRMVKVGALLVRFQYEPTRIRYGVLIFGLAPSGQLPWCHLTIVPVPGGDMCKPPGLVFDMQAEIYQSTMTNDFLQRELDGFTVDIVDLGPGISKSKHSHACDSLQLFATVELRRVSGKEVYLLSLHHIEQNHAGNIVALRR
ncbi:hypothetical protein VTL71DRAFT_2469 [Oculimacula yallundae]|uniref:Heterokaryon incompatibility domain-containing protein n=1 Tax=Oculimacula yallundae TaxID=86028 RepID=A0ABR4CB81_9HELO